MPQRIVKLKVLMAVYNGVACDGRAMRAAEAIAELSDLTLLGVAADLRCPQTPFAVSEIRLPKLPRLGPLRLFLFWLHVLVQIFRLRPHIVYAHDFFLLFPAWFASRLIRAKLVYDAHELIVPEGSRCGSFRHAFFYRIERMFAKRTDLTIAANVPRAQIMKARYDLPHMPVVVRNISPGSPSGDLVVEDRRNLALGCGRVRMLYQGSISLVRGLDLFIKVLPRLDKFFELFMVGDGPDLGRLREMAQREDVASRVTFLGRVSTQELATITRQCSIGIVSYGFDDPNQRHCAPNKVYEYAQAGIPMVATAQDTLRSLVEDNGIGLILNRGDSLDETLRLYAEGIEHLVQHRAQFVSRIPTFLRKNNWQDEKTKLANSLKELCQCGA